ncbi:PGN_0703 family putative restriction endonuclease [Yeosuana marina]|uniref:PGN_0703 family putative restriction endonuclease n=1 Tax=Yeosuana marina TaxID=1565536 RepID=UPI0030EB19DF|tara:strand:- start:2039 stop:2926 length:888 start_codon:yes stop_codon:yes gene_type:complete
MNGKKYIQLKQQNWAKRKGLVLIGGTKLNRGEKNYVDDLTSNIFNNQLSAETDKNFKEGDGGEMNDSNFSRAKMKALHSSSALPVNVFQYWQNKEVYPILYACKLCAKVASKENSNGKNILPNKVKFEQKFEISEDKNLFPRKPNLDVVIENNKLYAIESKFTEPYKKKQKGLSERYTSDKSFWKGLTHLEKLANKISPNNNKFKYLDAAQLIKHILGLKKAHKKSGFTLSYLWYDVIGKDGFEHRKEIEKFAEIAKKDKIKFRHITYQEVIINLSNNFYVNNENYIDYLTDRYL